MALEAGDTDGAASRAYYAMFHAATGKLLSKGIVPPKTHTGLASLFSEQCIKTGEYPADLGRLLAGVARLRRAADYSVEMVDQEIAERAISDAERFVAALKSS